MPDIRETVLLEHMDASRFRRKASSALAAQLKSAVRRFVVATADSPLKHLYLAIYRAHLRHAVNTLKKLPGVHSIYVTGGMATDDIQPGISDIDLTVNGTWTEAEELEVVETLKRLSRRSPLYDSLLSQSKQSLEQLKSLYASDLYVQYLFDRGRTRWKLLYGSDIFAMLPPVPENRVGGGYYMELRTWWSYFVKSAFGTGVTATDSLFRLSIPYKAAAGILVARAYFDGRTPARTRDLVLQDAEAKSSSPDRELLQRLIASRKSHHQTFAGDIQQETFTFLIRQMEAIHAELGNNPSFQKPGENGFHIDGSASELMVSDPARNFAHEVVAKIKAAWPGYRSAFLVPCLSFFYPDDLVLLLEVDDQTLPSVNQIRDLCAFALAQSGKLSQRVALYLLLPEAAYQLEIVSVIELWHHTLSRQANPEIFSFIERPEFVIDGSPRPPSGSPIWTRFAADLVQEEINIRRTAFAKSAEATDVPSLELLRNLWRQLQLEIVQRSTERNFTVLPMTVPSILRMLQHFDIPAGDILDQLRHAYESELNGNPIDVRPLIPQLMALFQAFIPDTASHS